MDLRQYIDKDGCCIIPDGVKIIKERAFQNCTNLKKISIPKSVTEIQGGLSEAGAFDGCCNLTDVFIHTSTAKIEPLAFSRCSGLKRIICPKTLINNGLGFNADSDCATVCVGGALVPAEIVIESISRKHIYSGLRQYINKDGHCQIPDSVTIIKRNEFMDCKYLKSVYIPKSVSEIGYGAFCGCLNLKKIICPKKLIDKGFRPEGDSAMVFLGGEACVPAEFVFEAESGRPIYYGLRQFIDNCGHCIVPNNITSIKNSEFSNCDYLNSISLPKSVRQIGRNAFEYCHNLSELSISNSTVQIGSDAFEGCSKLKGIICSKHVNDENNSDKNQEIISIENVGFMSSAAVESSKLQVPEESTDEEVTDEDRIIERIRYRFEELEFAKKRTQEALQQEKIAFDELKKVVMEYSNMKKTFIISQTESQFTGLTKTIESEGSKINTHSCRRTNSLRKSNNKTVSFGEAVFF